MYGHADVTKTFPNFRTLHHVPFKRWIEKYQLCYLIIMPMANPKKTIRANNCVLLEKKAQFAMRYEQAVLPDVKP
jgi:hypothetical protein